VELLHLRLLPELAYEPPLLLHLTVQRSITGVVRQVLLVPLLMAMMMVVVNYELPVQAAPAVLLKWSPKAFVTPKVMADYSDYFGRQRQSQSLTAEGNLKSASSHSALKEILGHRHSALVLGRPYPTLAISWVKGRATKLSVTFEDQL